MDQRGAWPFAGRAKGGLRMATAGRPIPVRVGDVLIEVEAVPEASTDGPKGDELDAALDPAADGPAEAPRGQP